MTSPVVHTTTTSPSGQAIFCQPPQFKSLTPNVGVIYTTSVAGPISFASEADIVTHDSRPVSAGLLVPTLGSSMIVCEWPAGKTNVVSPMHKTESLDLGVMIEGEVELVLNSGEKRLIKTGEVLIHRGTVHGWRNPSQTTMAKMVLFLLPSQKIMEPSL